MLLCETLEIAWLNLRIIIKSCYITLDNSKHLLIPRQNGTRGMTLEVFPNGQIDRMTRWIHQRSHPGS